NFPQPRQPKPPRDPNRRMFALCAALGVVLLAGGFVLGNAILDRSRERLAGLDQEVKDLDRQLTQMREDARRIRAIEEWDSLPWLGEIYEVTDKVPDIKALRFQSIQGTTLNHTANAKHVALLKIKGTARASDPRSPDSAAHLVNDLIRRFATAEGGWYLPKSPTIKGTTGGSTFEADISIERRPPSE